jgi:hypothetical protein
MVDPPMDDRKAKTTVIGPILAPLICRTMFVRNREMMLLLWGLGVDWLKGG